MSKYLAGLLLLILTSLFSISTLQFGETSNSHQAFLSSDVYGRIIAVTPTDNATYTEQISLNISVTYSARSLTFNGTSIPYQDITCTYQLDNLEWTNASLSYSESPVSWYDPTFQGYWNDETCHYNATLPSLIEGPHTLKISLWPNLKYYYRTSSDGIQIDSPINFYIFTNSSESMRHPTTEANGLNPFIIVIPLLIATICLLSIVFFIKLKGTNKRI